MTFFVAFTTTVEWRVVQLIVLDEPEPLVLWERS